MKLKSNPYVTSCLFALALACSASAADLTWNNGSSTSSWNTTDANWSGASWTAGDNAFFNSTTGTINLTQAISGGSLTFGTSGGFGANNTGSFTGSALTLSGNLTAIANGNNGAGGPIVSFSNNVSVAGDVSIGRRVLEVTNGTFTANRILSADSWGRLLITGGRVIATNGIDDSINGGNTLNVALQGGSLYTPYIKTTSAPWTNIPDDGVLLNGGTLYATANSADFIQTWDPGWGNRNNIGVSSGGAKINTNGFNITITKPMQDVWASGSLTKSGSGTLQLTASNTYTGGTTVNEGVLELAGAAWVLGNYSGGGVTVNSGATLRANNSVANRLNGLTLNGGTVDVMNTSGNGDWGNFFLTGDVAASGTSNLNADIALRASNVDFNVANGGTLNVGGVMHNGHEYGVNSGSPATVSKSGSGTMVLTAINTYTGATTINGGTLNLAGATGGDGLIRGDVTVNSGATLALSGGDGTGFGWGNRPSGVIINGGVVTTSGMLAHVWDIANGITMTGGTLQSNGGVSDANTDVRFEWNRVSVATNASANVSTISGRINIRGDAGYGGINFTVADGAASDDLLVSAAITGGPGITKSGAGTMRLPGANSYGGQTDITAGMLVAASSTALGTGGHNGATMSWIRDGATLGLQGGISLDEHFHVWGTGVGGLGAIRSISGNNALTNAPSGGPGYALRSNTTIGVDADTLSVSGFYNGDGGSYGITKTGQGSLTLTGNNSYTGDTNVTGGTLVVNGTISSSSLTTVASGATIGGSGTVGALTVSSGASINPGNSPGTLNVVGNYTQEGTLIAEITGLAAGTEHDQVNVTGTVTLSGLLSIQASGSPSYQSGDMIFLILNDGTDSIVGNFSNFSEGATTTFGGFDWTITYQADSTLTSFTGGNDVAFRAIPEPSAALLGGLSLLALLRRRRTV